jgi:hypothetical protein
VEKVSLGGGIILVQIVRGSFAFFEEGDIALDFRESKD